MQVGTWLAESSKKWLSGVCGFSGALRFAPTFAPAPDFDVVTEPATDAAGGILVRMEKFHLAVGLKLKSLANLSQTTADNLASMLQFGLIRRRFPRKK